MALAKAKVALEPFARASPEPPTEGNWEKAKAPFKANAERTPAEAKGVA